MDDPEGLKIVVRVFANVEYLNSQLCAKGLIADDTALRNFVAGFSGQFGHVDFGDVGSGKGAAHRKIQGKEVQI
jgi:hypothetical protein